MTTTERLAPTSKMSLDLRAQMALLARVLHREGYDDHIMGHISHSLADGSFLCTPWAITWDEMLPAHILHIGADGDVLEGDEEVPTALPLHVEVHRARPDARVIVHNHPGRAGYLNERFGHVETERQPGPLPT